MSDYWGWEYSPLLDMLRARGLTDIFLNWFDKRRLAGPAVSLPLDSLQLVASFPSPWVIGFITNSLPVSESAVVVSILLMFLLDILLIAACLTVSTASNFQINALTLLSCMYVAGWLKYWRRVSEWEVSKWVRGECVCECECRVMRQLAGVSLIRLSKSSTYVNVTHHRIPFYIMFST